MAQVGVQAESGELASNLSSRAERRALVLVAAAVVAALGLRAWALYARGVLDYDETYYYILGRNLFGGRGYTLNGLPHTAFPPLYPIFVGLTSLFTSNVRLATSLISAVAGALLPVAVYPLISSVGGRRAGVLGAWVAAVWPAFFFFAAISVTYRDRMYAGSEPLFLTLFVFGATFLWLAARRESLKYAALAGVFLGLSSLTRDEGTVLTATLGAWLVIDRTIFSTLPRSKRLLQIVLTAAAVLVAVSPFLIYGHSATGRWTLGSKLPNFVRVRPALYNWIINGDSRPYTRLHYALNADSTGFADDYWGVSSRNSGDGGTDSYTCAAHLIRNADPRWLPELGRVFARGKPPLVPWYGWALAAAGLVIGWNRVKARWALLAAAVAAVLVAQAVALYVLARFQLPFVALLIVPVAIGLDTVSRAFGRIARGAWRERLAAVMAAVVIAAMAAQGVEANYRGSRSGGVPGAYNSNPADLSLSRMLAERLPAGATLMSNEPWIAVYGGFDWRPAPWAKPDEMAAYARNRGIEYAILGEWQIGDPRAQSGLSAYLTEEINTGVRKMYLYDFTKGATQAAGQTEDKGPEEAH